MCIIEIDTNVVIRITLDEKLEDLIFVRFNINISRYSDKSGENANADGIQYVVLGGVEGGLKFRQ